MAQSCTLCVHFQTLFVVFSVRITIIIMIIINLIYIVQFDNTNSVLTVLYIATKYIQTHLFTDIHEHVSLSKVRELIIKVVC